ncbi:MAG: hypothetical protein J6X22_07340 [Muribaculaceae bacterium]|nr:hypothetical protein [Muribaculaceae bacterium]
MKCVNCFQEIGDNKFCNFCGTMQPIDREAYERELSERAAAMTNDNINPLAGSNTAPPKPQQPVATPAQPVQNIVPLNPVASNATTGNDGLMQCPDCGNMIPANSAFCPYCRCPFVAPNQQYKGGGTQIPSATMHRETPQPENNKKKGLSGWAKALITLAIITLLGVIGGAVYYFFFYNNVTKLRPDDELVEFSRNGGKKTVSIITDAREFEVTKHPDWVTVTTGDGEITIKCEPLDSYEEREGIIKLEAGDKHAKITVRQSANATHLSLSQDIIRTGHDGNEVVIEIETDGDPSSIDYSIDDLYMCRLSDMTSTGFTVVIEENLSPSPRECNITISSGKEEKTLTVIQAGRCAYCDGIGKETCLYCDGNGRSDCYNCGGSGEEYDYYLDGYKSCEECDGRGYSQCFYCDGKGYTSNCEYCEGTGNNFSRK